MPATPSKLNTSSIALRRSPRLNPPPRRSPRIEEQKQRPDEGVPEMDVGRAGIPDVHSPRLVHASPRSGTTPKSKSSTPSSARSPYVTPNIKTTPLDIFEIHCYISTDHLCSSKFQRSRTPELCKTAFCQKIFSRIIR